MSDFKSLFREAQAKRGLASSKQHLRKLKSKPKNSNPNGSGTELQLLAESKIVQVTVESADTADAIGHGDKGLDRASTVVNSECLASELMPPPPPRHVQSPKQMPEPQGDESRGPVISGDENRDSGMRAHAGVLVPGVVPEGFFEDKEADGLARGLKPRTSKDKETEYLDFQREMESEFQEIAKSEALAAAETAQDREDLEKFEHTERIKTVLQLREKQQGKKREVPVEEMSEFRKKPRIQMPKFESDAEDSSSADELCDWRAKAVLS